MTNCFMSPTEYAKADSENKPFLKQLFHSAGGEIHKFTHKHGIKSGNWSNQISPVSCKTGHNCLVEGNLHASWKLIHVTSFTYFTKNNKSGSNLFPISTQKPHPKLPQETATFQSMVQISCFYKHGSYLLLSTD